MLLSEIVATLRASYNKVELIYFHPTLYIVVKDDEFNRLEDALRIDLIEERTGVSGNQISEAMAELQVSLLLLSELEWERDFKFLDAQNSGNHWLSMFDPDFRDIWASKLASIIKDDSAARSLHFYGFKGGQARSTVLLMLGKMLAESGYRVLLVDADLEAPTLSVALNVRSSSLSSSVVGLARGAQIEPIAVETNTRGGLLHLLQARPAIDGFELDYASFVLRSNLDTSGLARSVAGLKDQVQNKYDFVLFDHRTGMASSVLPIIMSWPGSVVISARADGLSDDQPSIVSSLLSVDREYPGAFVCFSLDPEKKSSETTAAEDRLRTALLANMSDALSRGAESEAFLDPSALGDFFINWYHDRAFLSSGAPELTAISEDNSESLRKLRDILGVEPVAEIQSQALVNTPSGPSSPSGALDGGWFLVTPDAARLLQEALPSYYVYGRKGTGKTRLFREMVNRGLARAMHSAADYSGATIQAQSPTATALINLASGDYGRFWWMLLASELLSLQSNKSSVNIIQEWIDSGDSKAADPRYSVSLANSIKGRVSLAIDGIETAVEASKTGDFVESVFRFLSTVQNDSVFSEKIRFRLFIRSDLPVGLQNIEQQVHGRKIDLRWDEGSIFHYVLAEMARNAWFRVNFSDVCAEIDRLQNRIMYGMLPREEYEGILLEVFPQKLRRHNILTMTYLRTYFSDAAGESDNRSSFYPRVFGSFLSKIGDIGSARGGGAIDRGRVAHGLVHDAFESAAKDFITEIKQELNFALNLNPSINDNKKDVADLLEAFSGLHTPFSLDEFVKTVSARLSGSIQPGVVRDALRRMKEMGIFEVHPADSTKWRAGRLFKEGLGMKYYR